MKDEAHRFFDEAYAKLSEANKELFRPEEDIVSYLVCKNAQFAVKNYLSGYLLKNGVDITGFTSIDTLYEQCVRLNSNFQKIDLTEFTCHAIENDAKHCDEVTKVSHCFRVANDLDTFFRKENIIG